MYTFS